MFTVSKAGIFLPMQLIYEGKTDHCLPVGVRFPNGCDVTYTPNHWSNEEKVIEHLNVIIVPFLAKQREELTLQPDQKAMLILDIFKGQKTTAVTDVSEEKNHMVVYVPPNMTDYFQPLDLTINGPAKQVLKTKYEEWYAREIEAQLNGGIDIYSVDVP